SLLVKQFDHGSFQFYYRREGGSVSLVHSSSRCFAHFSQTSTQTRRHSHSDRIHHCGVLRHESGPLGTELSTRKPAKPIPIGRVKTDSRTVDSVDKPINESGRRRVVVNAKTSNQLFKSHRSANVRDHLKCNVC